MDDLYSAAQPYRAEALFGIHALHELQNYFQHLDVHAVNVLVIASNGTCPSTDICTCFLEYWSTVLLIIAIQGLVVISQQDLLW